MTRTRFIVRVFLASPGDVSKERNKTEQVVSELNRSVAPQLGIMIELVRWEDFVPGMGRPEQVILEQADIEQCDVFIGILWNRFGTPTGHAESGTEEEFEVAYSCWQKNNKPRIMFYFCQNPSNLQTVQDIRQKEKVINFRSKLSKLGIYNEYNEAADFESLLRQNLTKHLLSLKLPAAEASMVNSEHIIQTEIISPPVSSSDLVVNNSVDISKMVLVPKGDFLYGRSAKKITIPYDYYIDLTPVTNSEFVSFLKETDYMLKYDSINFKVRIETIIAEAEKLPDHPIAGMTWFDAVAFATWRGKRLPTNLEWEKAARGTDGRLYPWGNDFDNDKCNSNESFLNQTTNVYKYENGRSPYGCYDMAGNVFEWTDDWSDTPRFTSSPNSEKCNRGASYNRESKDLITWYMESDPPTLRMSDVGFRCVYVKDKKYQELFVTEQGAAH